MSETEQRPPALPEPDRKGFYRQVFLTLAEAREFIWGAVFLFAFGVTLGIFFPAVSRPFLLSFGEIARQLANRNPAELILLIFLRNLTASGIALLAGAAFALLPTAAAMSNGIILGAVLSLVPWQWWKVVPHGIFELPAMFISWGLGLWLSLWILGPSRFALLKQRLGRCLQVFAGLVVPLLLVAATIEALTAFYIYR